jgi:ABC-2 type transport system permease protein
MVNSLRQFLAGSKVSVGHYIADLNPWVILGVDIPRALLQAMFFILMALAAGGSSQARFALIGNAVHVAVHISIIYMAGVIEMEKWAGTLVYWIASPAEWLPTMLGRSVADFGRAIYTSAITFTVLIPIIAPDIRWMNLLRAVPAILLTLASASSIGWLIGSISLPVRWGTMIGNLVAYILMIFCGINFPVTSLPSWIQIISHWIPVTHGLLAIRAIIDGASYGSVLPLLGREVLIALGFASFAWFFFGYRLYILRRGGNLDLM